MCWFYFSGFNIPYQYTVFIATLLSLSGTFNTLLFFFARPAWVVGSNSALLAPVADTELQASNNRDLINPRISKFMSLPRHSLAASYGVLPNLELDFNEQPYKRDLDARQALQKNPNQGKVSTFWSEYH